MQIRAIQRCSLPLYLLAYPCMIFYCYKAYQKTPDTYCGTCTANSISIESEQTRLRCDSWGMHYSASACGFEIKYLLPHKSGNVKGHRGFDAENDRFGCDNKASSRDLKARVNYLGPLQSTIYLSTFIYTIVCIDRYLSSAGAVC